MTSEDKFNPPEYRLFSIEEANKLLPELEIDFVKLRNLNREVSIIVEEKKKLSKDNGKIHLSPEKPPAELEILTNNLETISKMVDKIQDLGIIIKDIDTGLVDFPHRRNDRIVYLCWQSGEKEINFWHEIEAGKAGRKPL